MGVRKKWRRKLTVGKRLFVWYVADDPDSDKLVLQVISDDKRFIVRYHLGQTGTPFLAVLGREFPGVPDAGGCWRRFECPRWEEEDEALTPKSVRRLIDWSLSPSKPLIEVNWLGQRIAQES